MADWIKINPVIDMEMPKLCQKPYHNHIRGCPNFSHKAGCPPKARPLDTIIDLTQPVYAIYNKFDFGSHVEKMRQKFPNWSEYQVRCVLYWQGTARKQLKEKVKTFQELYPGHIIFFAAEANGVNWTETMKNVGIVLEWPPQKWAYQIALAGRRKIR
jgi:predicted metal-binding protein